MKYRNEITFDDFTSGLLHWRESTSMSLSGRHLGVYKSLLTSYIDSGGEFNYTPDPNDTTIKHMAQSILEVIHGLATKAASQGFY